MNFKNEDNAGAWSRFSQNREGNMLPPEVENEFLNNIIEFEKQFQSRKE